AHNVVVSDDLPLNLRFESATTTKGSCDPALPTCTMDSLDPGESATVTIAATFLPISTQGPLLTNTVTATADDEDGDAGDNTASHSIEVLPFTDISVTKSGPDAAAVGDTVTYTITLSHSSLNDVD